MYLIFADLPSTRPAIYGLRSLYRVGEHVNLTCESGPSSPPTSLSWFLNGAKIPHEEPLVTDMVPVYPLPDRRAISRSFLSLPLTEETLPLPLPFLVKCEAAVGVIYKKYAKVRVRLSGRKMIKDPVTDWMGWVQHYSGVDGRGRRGWLFIWDLVCLCYLVHRYCQLEI